MFLTGIFIKKGGEMVASKKHSMLGSWAFLIGVVLAVVLGALSDVTSGIVAVLVVLGLIVGLFNINDEEVKPFLLAGTVLVIVSALGSDVLSAIPAIGRVFDSILALFVPATVIVALKSVFGLARK